MVVIQAKRAALFRGIAKSETGDIRVTPDGKIRKIILNQSPPRIVLYP